MFGYANVSPRRLASVLTTAGIEVGVVMLLVGDSAILAHALYLDRFGQTLSDFFSGVTDNRYVFLLLVNVLLLLVGMFLEPLPALYILAWPLSQVAINVYHINPVHFGLIMVFSLVLALIHPPMGLVIFLVSSLAKVSIERLSIMILPWLAVSVLVLFLVTYLPTLGGPGARELAGMSALAPRVRAALAVVAPVARAAIGVVVGAGLAAVAFLLVMSQAQERGYTSLRFSHALGMLAGDPGTQGPGRSDGPRRADQLPGALRLAAPRDGARRRVRPPPRAARARPLAARRRLPRRRHVPPRRARLRAAGRGARTGRRGRRRAPRRARLRGARAGRRGRRRAPRPRRGPRHARRARARIARVRARRGAGVRAHPLARVVGVA